MNKKVAKHRPFLVVLLLLGGDTFAIIASFLAAFFLRRELIPMYGGVVHFQTLAPLLGMVWLVIVGLFTINHLYPSVGRTGVVELKEILQSITIAFAIIGLAIFVLGYGNQYSRFLFLAFWILCYIFICSSRSLLHNRGSRFPWWGRPVAVIGLRKDIEEVVANLQRARRMALKPAAAIILGEEESITPVADLPTFPYSSTILKTVKNYGVNTAIIFGHTSQIDSPQKDYLQSLSLTFPKVIYVMGESPLSSLAIRAFDLEGHPALQVQYNLLNRLPRLIKRCIDLVICLIGIVCVLPVCALFVLIIRLDSPGPAIFTQKRVGKNGKIFNLFKFRTMVIDADEQLESLLESNEQLREEYHRYHKITNDPRMTRFGRFLRKTSLDELPQFINVARGEMSVVGPRAYLPKELPRLGDTVDIIQRVTPGITGWWQVMGRHDVTFDQRIQLDTYYISNFSLWMDVYIIFKTIWVVISEQGV